MAELRPAVKKVQKDGTMKLHKAFIDRVLNMADRMTAVISNGRVGMTLSLSV